MKCNSPNLSPNERAIQSPGPVPTFFSNFQTMVFLVLCENLTLYHEVHQYLSFLQPKSRKLRILQIFILPNKILFRIDCDIKNE